MTVIGWDTETHLISPTEVIPRLVCLSWASKLHSAVVGNNDLDVQRASLRFILEGSSVAHRASFDWCVVSRAFPELIPDIFEAYGDGRIHCTIIRQKLIELGKHGSIERNQIGAELIYTLAALAERLCGRAMEKEGEDHWRLRYCELEGINARDYPTEAYVYSVTDARAVREVFYAQEPYAQTYLKSEALHVRAAFALNLMTGWGVRVDVAMKEKIQALVLKDLDPANLPALYEGTNPIIRAALPPRPTKNRAKAHVAVCRGKLRKDCTCPLKLAAAKAESVNVKGALQPLIIEVCNASGMPIKYTEPSDTFPTGQVSKTTEVIEKIMHLDPRLEQFVTRQKISKLKTSYFPALEWPLGSGLTPPVTHPDYDELKKTGRVSARGNTKQTKNPLYPRVAIQQADPRIRKIYVARGGMVYVVIDYSAMELCAFGHQIYTLFGSSKLRDQINAGQDPHCFLGNVLAFDDVPEWRNMIRNTGGDEAVAYNLFMDQKTERSEWWSKWRNMAKPFGLGFPGGLGLKTMVGLAAGYKVYIDEARAKHIRNIWYRVYPNHRRYLKEWVTRQNDTYTSPRGMVRSNCTYPQLANGFGLQTPGAEGMKEALWDVSRACYDESRASILYGSRPVINMHDELVIEIPDDDDRHDRAMEIKRLMEEGMARVLTSVKITADPVLTHRWDKKAEQVFDDQGKLIPWRSK